MEEVFRSRQPDLTLIHRVVKDEEGRFSVEAPVVGTHSEIDDWVYVGGGPGQPNPSYDTLGEARAFIDGLEEGLQGINAGRKFKDEKEQRAYDEGLKFGLEL